MKRLEIPKTSAQKVLRTRKKMYVQEIASVNLSKIYSLKNAKKTCKPNKLDLKQLS